MATWLVALISVEYLLAAGAFVAQGKYGLALFSFGCVVANAGLLMTARG